MCGIAGLADLQTEELEMLVTRMGDTIRHRGPDDAGVRSWPDEAVAICSRRLAIIDLSQAGHQPMGNEDGKVWLVFNGEIYNFRELRSELERLGHRFRSRTDTEVVLHAYEQWGDDHVHRLRGMFAYALYDRRDLRGRRGRLLLVRDRLGIKPLFFYRKGTRFAFASELKALFALPGTDRELDLHAISDYLTYQYVPAPKTIFRHIRKLMPGHWLSLEDDEPTVKKYWDVDASALPAETDHEEAIQCVGEKLEEVVRAHLVADVPVGVFLSGGIDSSIVTALTSAIEEEPVRTFTVDFDVKSHSEAPFARLVANQFGTAHNEQHVGVASARELLAEVVDTYDEPFADGSAVPTLRLVRHASSQVKVVLSGDGGDELFAGYRWYERWLRRSFADRWPIEGRRALFGTLRRLWPTGRRGSGLLGDLVSDPFERFARQLELFSPAEKAAIAGPELRSELKDYDHYWSWRRYWREELDPLTRMQYVDLKTYLPDDILTKVDRAGMAYSLEVRPPFLDHTLVELVFSLPASIRSPMGAPKALLKQVASDFLPAVVVGRAKKGFSAPWTEWMRSETDWALGTLSSRTGSDIVTDASSALPRLFSRGSKVWSLLVLKEFLGRHAP